uniref:Murine leukemia virus integrase C-terminal domain-containing protein n=1 Tax=Gadus morhua TaxID=8049 RepID=A0A8C5CR13_GADMO
MSETISKPVPTIVSHVPLEQKFLISPTSPVTVHPRVNPRYHLKYGDMIMLKSLNPNVLLPRWQGPTQVLLTTRTAVKLQGKPEWIHASRCRPAPPEEESTNELSWKYQS